MSEMGGAVRRLRAALAVGTAAALLAMWPVPGGAAGPGTTIVVQDGFDTCTAPSTAVLDKWWTASPYRFLGVYIGGAARACLQPNLTPSWITHQSATGWRFVNTWVGPQAPCTSYSARFSYDKAKAYSRGVAEADRAYAAAAKLGYPVPDVIVYYDLEGFDTTNKRCAAAARALVNGWTHRLKAKGAWSGLYGSACASAMDSYASISRPPDDVWIAHWNGTPGVYSVSCVASNHWTQHQRIHQYVGGAYETYGGYTLNIDKNCSDARMNGRVHILNGTCEKPKSAGEPTGAGPAVPFGPLPATPTFDEAANRGSGTVACSAAALAARAGPAGAWHGQATQQIELRNLGGRACSLPASPSIWGRTAAGSQPLTAPSEPSRPGLTLNAGAVAEVTVATPGTCRSAGHNESVYRAVELSLAGGGRVSVPSTYVNVTCGGVTVTALRVAE